MLADLGPGSPERTAAVEGPGPRDRRVQHVTGATLCRLQPRPEERIVRPDDVTDFVKRYGHEYAVVVVSADCPTIASVAEAEGCAVVVTQGPR